METTEELARQSAVGRYLAMESITAICQDIGRPRKWLYKWIGRFGSGDPDWFRDDSRRPKHMPSKTPAEMAAQVIAARKCLEGTPYASRGVFAIRQKLSDAGITDAPSDPTINRIIKEGGLVRKEQRRGKVGTPYPAPAAEAPNDVHQADIWGPQYLGKGSTCYVLNIIDVARRGPSINPVPDKTYGSLIPCLTRSWQTLGIPRILQMDNFTVTGTAVHPGSICSILRLCLHVGIEPLLVPFSEPWRQGIVEKFNDFFDKTFFCQHRFESYEHLCRLTKAFEEHCWQERRLPALKGRTPAQVRPEAQIELLPEGFKVDTSKLGVPSGKISFIRMVRSSLEIDVLGFKFTVQKQYYREYVTATLFTGERILRVYHQGRQIGEFQFSMCKS